MHSFRHFSFRHFSHAYAGCPPYTRFQRVFPPCFSTTLFFKNSYLRVVFDIIAGKQPHPFFGVVCCALKHGSTFPPLPDSHSRSQKREKKSDTKITLTIPLSSRYYSQANTASQHRLALWRLRATPATTLPPSRTQIYVLEDRKKKTVPTRSPCLNTTRLRTATPPSSSDTPMRLLRQQGFKSAGHTCVCNF